MKADDLDDGLAYEVDYSEPEGETVTVEAPVAEKSGEKTSKKRAKSDKLADKKRLKMEMDIEAKKKLSLESQPEVIADFINGRIRQKNGDLSALELSELYFNKTDIRSTADFDEPRTLDNMAGYITKRFSNMVKTKKDDTEAERKFIAVVSMSALRACDVHRATRDVTGSSLKLINKNKIDVDLKLVKSTRSRILCCTPGRLEKVLKSDDSELKASEIKIIIVDNSYLDGKKQNVWDIKETVTVLKQLVASGSKVYLY